MLRFKSGTVIMFSDCVVASTTNCSDGDDNLLSVYFQSVDYFIQSSRLCNAEVARKTRQYNFLRH